MQLTPLTVSVLKNFATINPGIRVKAGKVLDTISPAKSIIASAEVDQEFDREFILEDLGKFLSGLGLFEAPDLKFGEKAVTITVGDRNLRFTYGAPGKVVTRDRELKVKDWDVEFDLADQDLKETRAALSIMKFPEFVITGDGKTISFGATNTASESSDTFWTKVGETDRKFKAVLPAENVKILPGAYKVQLHSRLISFWAGPVASYFIAMSERSEFK